MYIRTHNGIIDICIAEDDNYWYYKGGMIIDKSNREIIKKEGGNILKVLEAGDVVNGGLRIISIKNGLIRTEHEYLEDIDIDSVITHEYIERGTFKNKEKKERYYDVDDNIDRKLYRK